jgi:glycosyltransferase involved in cell wall biosynthesis
MKKNSNKMSVLLSAYACMPYEGSEPAVGWNWLIESTKTEHSITMLTREYNRAIIEKYFDENDQPKNLDIIYYDLPKRLMFIEKVFSVYVYYILWQIGAFYTAKKTHAKVCFDQVHHVTFATIRQPSFMGLLGIPFIYGPVGGGESPPYKLVHSFPLKPKIKELARMISNALVKFDPLMHLTFYKASKIFVTSDQTKNLIAGIYQSKVKVRLAIGLSGCMEECVEDKRIAPQDSIKLLFVGRYEYWKGVHLCIKSLVILKKENKEKNISLTLVGEGPFEKKLKLLANQLGVDDLINWLPWMTKVELDKHYESHDLLVFPSLHDSGGMVVLEALEVGMPVICLSLGGPATIVTRNSGQVINANQTEAIICQKIAQHVISMCLSENYLSYSKSAYKRSQYFTWNKLVTELL